MSAKWSKSQLEKFRSTMKAKKELLKQKELNKSPEAQITLEAPREDIHRNYEYHYRRGLVTAMECILRELR